MIFKTTKFVSNVLEANSKLKLKNSKNHFSIRNTRDYNYNFN